VIAGELFAIWQSATWDGQESANQLAACFLLVAIFVMQPDDRGAN